MLVPRPARAAITAAYPAASGAPTCVDYAGPSATQCRPFDLITDEMRLDEIVDDTTEPSYQSETLIAKYMPLIIVTQRDWELTRATPITVVK